jgi:hypothetical protein
MSESRSYRTKALAIDAIARSNMSDRMQELDRRLDGALRDSFPASDPTAITVDHPAALSPSAKQQDITS